MAGFIPDYLTQIGTYTPPLENRHGYSGALLDFNERTIPISPKIKAALIEFIQTGKVHAYPEYFDLCEKIAQYAGVAPNQVMFTSGSEQGIDLIFRVFTGKNTKTVIPSPTFTMFFQFANVMQTQVISPLYDTQTGAFPLSEVLNILSTERPALCLICNPNNPTGTLVPLSDLETVLKKALETHTVVYVDEAYFEFSQVSAVPFLNHYPNLIITRTFSKAFGFSSLRMGYLMAHPDIIANLLKIRGPYDVNMMCSIAANTALMDLSDMDEYRTEIMKNAKPIMEAFFQAHGIHYLPSAANYILFDPAPWVAKGIDLQTYLEAKGFRLRPQKQPSIQNWLRVSIGTVEQMKSLVLILSELPV